MYFASAILFICLCFTACNSIEANKVTSTIDGQSDQPILNSSISEASDDTLDQYTFHLKSFYPKCTNQYLVPPYLFNNEVIISDAETYSGKRNMDTTSINIESLEETGLGFFAYDTQSDGQCYYWMKPGVNAIMQTDKDTLTSETMFTLTTEAEVMPRLSFGSKTLIWLELSGEPQSPVCQIKKFDCETQKEELIAETNYVFSPYFRFKVKSRHMAYAEKSEDGYIICGLDIKDPQSKASIITSISEPKGLVYDGTYLVWSDTGGAYFLSPDSSEKVKIASGQISDVDILDNRYIVFMSIFQINVYDIDSQEIVYQTSGKDGKEYVLWFSTNEDSTAAVFTGWETGKEDVSFIAVLSSQQSDKQ